jgi:hypothetical protein
MAPTLFFTPQANANRSVMCPFFPSASNDDDAARMRRERESKEAVMFRFLTTCLFMRFWASPYHSMHSLFELSSDVWAIRNAREALDPGFPRDDPPVEPPQKPARPIPTDVPMPEPMDVPAPEPTDVPVPDPGTVPTPAKPKPKNHDPKPRNVP